MFDKFRTLLLGCAKWLMVPLCLVSLNGYRFRRGNTRSIYWLKLHKISMLINTGWSSNLTCKWQRNFKWNDVVTVMNHHRNCVVEQMYIANLIYILDKGARITWIPYMLCVFQKFEQSRHYVIILSMCRS